MLFGFLFLDLILFGLLPFIVLLSLWSDSKGWAALITVAALVGLFFTGDITLAMFTDKVWWGNVLKFTIGYCTIGVLFSLIKWKFHSVKAAKSFRDFNERNGSVETRFDKYVQEQTARNMTSEKRDELLAEKDKWIADLRIHMASKWNGSDNLISVVPKADGGWETVYNKVRLTSYVIAWTVYWPFYVVLLVLDDLLRNLAEWFVTVFGQAFKRMADSSFQDIK